MLFNRTYRLLVGKQGEQKGIEIKDSLRITFDIQKSSKKDPNKSRISIWNLTKASREKFEEPNRRVVLYAGYLDDQGALMIFQGDVTFAYTAIDKADISTIFEVGDGSRSIRDSIISVGYAPGVESSTILEDASKSMDMPLVIPGDVPKRKWDHGFSYYGSSHGLIEKVTSATGLEWSVQNGDMQIIEKGGVTTKKGVLISSHSGMIGAPERIREAKTEKAGEKTEVIPNQESLQGWKVKTLLMPTINPGDRVELQSKVASGIFRVTEIKHVGDSHGDDWRSEMTLNDPDKPIGKEGSKGGGKKAAKTKQIEPLPTPPIPPSLPTPPIPPRTMR